MSGPAPSDRGSDRDPAPPEALAFDRDGDVPNSRWPALLYRAALPGGADDAIGHLAANGWGGAWVDGVFPYPHYHPNAHEALAVVAGRATLRLGGAAGCEVTVEAGDVVVLPAGTGHERVRASDDFRVVGAYPEDQHDFETRRAGRDEPAPPDRVDRVPRPDADPVLGGRLADLWP